MKKQNLITVHTYALTQLLFKHKTDFSDIRSFNIYKKNQIYHVRNQHLSHALNTSISNSDLAQTLYGKPYLLAHPQLAFNHSHSQQNYALAISENYAHIGVDVEDLSRKVRYDALAKHAFHPNELQLWTTLNLSTEYWFKVWTTKEAVLKASGLGIRISLNELDTRVTLDGNMGICHHPTIGTWCYQNVHLHDMMLTVAWEYDASQSESVPEIDMIAH